MQLKIFNIFLDEVAISCYEWPPFPGNFEDHMLCVFQSLKRVTIIDNRMQSHMLLQYCLLHWFYLFFHPLLQGLGNSITAHTVTTPIHSR